MADHLALANSLERLLDKSREDLTRADLLDVISKKEIERITFHYTGGDGHLKELRIPVSSRSHADRILASGERVDGSSLFKRMVDSASSDLYVVPRYKTAFFNPFDDRSLDFVCRFLDREAEKAPFPPDNILEITHDRFREATGLELHALGELEFYLLRKIDSEHYVPERQAGYHASTPYFKSNEVVNEMLRHITRITGAVKYAHSEVGFIDSLPSRLPELAGMRGEQHEIELLTRPIEEMGDFVALAKWIIRNVAFRRGMLATFAPKLEEGVAGSGMHFHMELMRDGRNVMIDESRALSQPAHKLIGGLVHYASTLSAFGNTVASSFLRLVPNQEAPTRICWSDSNRSALIRVPLGWTKSADLASVVNPREPARFVDERGVQTVEIRSPDGSAMIHLLLAGITTAAQWGLTQEGMIDLSARTRVHGNIFADKELLARLEPLPGSCVAASRLLAERRDMYEKAGCFPPQVIDYVIAKLAKEDDEHLNRDLAGMPEDDRVERMRGLMHRDIHRH